MMTLIWIFCTLALFALGYISGFSMGRASALSDHAEYLADKLVLPAADMAFEAADDDEETMMFAERLN